MQVFNQLLKRANKKGAGYFILIDPDTRTPKELAEFVKEICSKNIDGILIGGSLIVDSSFNDSIIAVKKASNVPVIIFPGSLQQISPIADAILFLSVISGRNPQYLFGDHVIAAPNIKKYNIEPISTGYMLFQSGRTTTAEFITNTKPLPPHKPEIAMAHALAAQYLGMKTVYLEAGSGADHSVPTKVVKAISSYVDIPIIVGGGIKTPDEAREKVEAGAKFIVTGNLFDDYGNLSSLDDFVKAIHTKESY